MVAMHFLPTWNMFFWTSEAPWERACAVAVCASDHIESDISPHEGQTDQIASQLDTEHRSFVAWTAQD